MRILVFFDLPVVTKKQRKNYTNFRKFLIKDGYQMLQFSVYCRVTRNHDDAEKHINRLRGNLPPEGSVRVMLITEKQYNSMEILVGEITATENYLSPRELIEL
jgi:CRISPR-associated protein Cas2